MDRRIVRTKAQLRAALSALMQEKPINEITVSELTERVNISRGTFYLHYKNVFDMLSQIEDEIILQLQEILRNAPKDVQGNPFWALRPLYDFFAREGDFTTVVIGPNGDPSFLNRIRETLLEQRCREMASAFPGGSTQDFRYLFSFLFGGSFSMLEVWLSSGRKESPAEMADRTEKIIMTGIHNVFHP